MSHDKADDSAHFWTTVKLKLEGCLDSWVTSLAVFFRVSVIVPALIAFVALYYANEKGTDRAVSVSLNIFASFVFAIAGAVFWDLFKEYLGNTVLTKKGRSAVRNLSLARQKTKNISERLLSGAKQEEITNLLRLLELDVANSTQEWNDIVPGVENIEMAYNLLHEKETELREAITDKEALEKDAIKTRALESDVTVKTLEIAKLRGEVERLKIATSNTTSAVTTSPAIFGLSAGGAAFMKPSPGLESYTITNVGSLGRRRFCSVCGRLIHLTVGSSTDPSEPVICSHCRNKP